MRRPTRREALVALLICVGCAGSDPEAEPDSCVTHGCPSGLACDPADGLCKCGGFACADGEACNSQALCVPRCPESCPREMSCDAEAGLCRCGSLECAEGTRCDQERGRCVPVLENRCTAGSSWAPGVAVFREVTDAWGLRGVEGVRLSVGDIDADGLPDLSVRRGGTGADDFAAGGTRATWLLRNEGGRFVDVTQSSGFVRPRRGASASAGRPGEIVAWADVDNDGDLDALTAVSNADPTAPQTESTEILLNRGDGTFDLGPESSAVRREGELVARSSAAFVDFDRDGKVDLWMGNSAVKGRNPDQDQLYRSLGEGLFEDVTAARGLATKAWGSVSSMNKALAHSYAWSVAACDLSGDGVPELLAASYGRAPNHLWLAGFDAANEVYYLNHSIASGYAFDGRIDWTDNESARCWCQLHPDAEDCAGVPAPQYIRCESDADAFRWDHGYDREPFRLGGNSATTVCADVDNDGLLDLLTTEIVHWDVGGSSDPSELLLNSGESRLRFDRPGNEATGLLRGHGERVDWNDGDMTAAVFDFDNDARPDVYVGSSDYPGTRGLLWWQKPDGTFAPVPPELGVDQLASHGIAVADFDRDGDLDVVAGHSRARCEDQCYPTANVRFFENVLGQGGNWVQLQLVGGEQTNRSAIGARVRVTSGAVTQTQEVGGGHGHYGMQHDSTLHFGLGTACEATVEVRWPDRPLSRQQFTLQSGYRYRIRQGEDPEPIVEAP